MWAPGAAAVTAAWIDVLLGGGALDSIRHPPANRVDPPTKPWSCPHRRISPLAGGSSQAMKGNVRTAAILWDGCIGVLLEASGRRADGYVREASVAERRCGHLRRRGVAATQHAKRVPSEGPGCLHGEKLIAAATQRASGACAGLSAI